MKLLNVFTPSAIVLSFLLTGCSSARYNPPPVAGYPHPPPLARTPDSAPPPVVVRSHGPVPRTYQRPEPWADVSITLPERQVIQGYVAGYVIQEKHPQKGRKPKRLPPGLQKKLDRGGSLPPGWEAKLRKGEILPLEVYEQAHSLPQEVLAKLPPQPPGTVIIAVGGKVARILAATREILDVFEVQF